MGGDRYDCNEVLDVHGSTRYDRVKHSMHICANAKRCSSWTSLGFSLGDLERDRWVDLIRRVDGQTVEAGRTGSGASETATRGGVDRGSTLLRWDEEANALMGSERGGLSGLTAPVRQPFRFCVCASAWNGLVPPVQRSRLWSS